jgi:hypothetical protein
MSLQKLVQDHVSGRQRMPIAFELAESRLAFWTATLETLGEPLSIFAYWAELREQRKREILSTLFSQNPPLALHLYALQSQNDPNNQASLVKCIQAFRQCTSSFEFPLSVDHQLFTMIQYNALRGVMTNMSILLHLNGRPLEGWADLYTEDLPNPPDHAPPSLQPTYLQKIVKHESWVDIIPYPVMRDNILRNQDNLDADALCDDFLGGMYEGLGDVQNRGMILWGEPWSGDGWEISEGFARKWSFLLKGCEDLIKSTNRWRKARGEKRLIVEL